MKVTNILRAPLGLATLLDNEITKKVLENKTKISFGIVAAAEMVNVVATGDVILPDVPYSPDPMFDSFADQVTNSVFGKNPISANLDNSQMQPLIEKPNNVKTEEKLQSFFEIYADPSGSPYKAVINNLNNNNSPISIDLRNQNNNIYYCTYAPQKITFLVQGENQESIENLYACTYENILNNRITGINDQFEYNKAVLAVNHLAFTAPSFRNIESYQEVKQYIKCLINLIESKSEYRELDQSTYEEWKSTKNYVLEQEKLFGLKTEEVKQINHVNKSHIIGQHLGLFNKTITDYNKFIQNQIDNNSTGGIDHTSELEQEELIASQKRLEKLAYLNKINQVKEENLRIFQENCNSVKDRCEGMLKKIGIISETIQTTLSKLDVGYKTKFSLILGAMATFTFGIFTIFNNKDFLPTVFSMAKKLLHGSGEVIPPQPTTIIREHFTEKVTEKIIDNTLKDNIMVGLSSIGFSKIVEKVLKYAKK